jgi:Response regulator containing CheY-like receiver, AAA-type ATPase, and DNA-binding domains
MDGTERQKLLIIDDDCNWTEALRLFFSDKYDVVVVNSAADALDKIRGDEPDAIIVDLVMPTMDGFGLMRRLNDGAVASVPIILLTGWKTAEVEQCATSFGCAAVLGKPVEPDVLEEVVATVVRSKGARAVSVT